MTRDLSSIAVAAGFVALCATPAIGNAVRSGNTQPSIVASVRGTATAYDSVSHVYLVVSANGTGNIFGRCVGLDGTALGVQFPIQTSFNYTHFPRVAFSPDAGTSGAFLVTWSESDLPSGVTSLHTRLVSYAQGGTLGPDNQVGNNIGALASYTNYESGNAVAYSIALPTPS